MPFQFTLISEADILRSPGGNLMMNAINYPGVKHMLVTGCPGSGKTTVSIMRATKRNREGKSILLLTYQNMLRIALGGIAGRLPRARIATFHRWHTQSTNGKYVDRRTADEMVEDIRANNVFYDEILIDEGQDFEARFIETAGRCCTQLVVSSDTAQKLHEQGLDSAQIMTLVTGQFGAVEHFNLEHNYRNNYETYLFAINFVPNNLRASNQNTLTNMYRGKTGSVPIIFHANEHEETLNILRTRLNEAGEINVAVLLYHVDDVDYYYEAIPKLGNFKCSKYHNEMTKEEKAHTERNLQNILVTTYKSAKGMEFEAVIMPDMHLARSEHFMTEEHYYVGCTRAKENLYLIFEGQMPAYLDTFDKTSYNYRPYEDNDDEEDDGDYDNFEEDLPF